MTDDTLATTSSTISTATTGSAATLAQRKGINAKVILLAIAAMICVHLVVFVFYSAYSKRSEAKVNRDLMTRQIISLIQTVKTAPVDERKEIISNLYVPNLKATLDSKSLYEPTFQNVTLWFILEKISKQGKQIQFSLFLEEERWMNVSATIGPTSWGLQVVLLVLEIAALSAIFFSVWSIGRFRVPLENFTRAADRLGVDINAAPLLEYGPAIVRSTAQSINKMQDLGYDVEYHHTEKRLALFGRPLSLKRAFTNLINNGIKYGEKVRVSIKQSKKGLSIFIDDDGPGLNEAQLKMVFEPFYRAESSRSRTTGGTGLGLAVVRDIIHAHEGTVNLEKRRHHQGLCAIIEFPASVTTH